MALLHSFDKKFIQFAGRYYGLLARGSLFIIFFYFGLLKLLKLSPADSLAEGFAAKLGFGLYSYELYLLLAVVECVIGIMILIPRLTRPAIFIMLIHLVLVCSPLLLYPEAVWLKPFVPTLEGQYIIKNAALVALALGLVARTRPLR